MAKTYHSCIDGDIKESDLTLWLDAALNKCTEEEADEVLGLRDRLRRKVKKKGQTLGEGTALKIIFAIAMLDRQQRGAD